MSYLSRLCVPAVLLIALWASTVEPAVAASDVLPPHLAALRLQGPVLVEGQTGAPLEQRMGELRVPGVSVAVCSGGEVEWAEAWGVADAETREPVTTETLFQAASISKPVAAAGVLRQVDRGKLELDQGVNRYLATWKLPDNELTEQQPVTLERLLSHGAGLTVHGFPGYAVDASVPTVPQILDGTAPANTSAVRVDLEPGSQFRYSGGGYTVAQLVVSDALGDAFPAVLERTVLRPAGMLHSTYEQPLPPGKLSRAAAGHRRNGAQVAGKRHTYPEMAAAGLWTTPSDLCRFAMSIQSSRAGEEGALLSEAMANRMTTRFTGPAALGFFVEPREDGEVYFEHGGANEGFRAYLIASRDHGFAAAVMTNSDNGSPLADEIVRGIARRGEWPGYLPEVLPDLPLTDDERAAIVGRYRIHGDEAVELAEQDGRLTLRSPGSEPAPLFQVAAGELSRLDREARYRVEREGDQVTGITWVRPGRDGGEPQTSSVERMADGEVLPFDRLAEGELEEAAAAYRRLFGERPDDPGVAEPRLNRLGYQLAGRGELEQALTVLALNVEFYPSSANCYDSLAEISLQAGDRDRALSLYRKVLEVLPRDREAAESFAAQLRANAESKIRELSAKE